MQNTTFRVGPLAILTSVEDLLNPPIIASGVNIDATETYLIVKQVKVVNTTGSAVDLSLYLGGSEASAAGTEVLASELEIAANSIKEFFCQMQMGVADFLTGEGSAVGLTITITGEIGVK